MTLNPYSMLAAFLAVLEAGLGLVVLVLVARAALRRRRRAAISSGASGANSASAADGVDVSEAVPLIAWTGVVLVALSVLSWPLLYLLLESYVPFWYPRVMCIEGVCRIGTGSMGPSAALPGLLTALQWTKPALVFLGGAFVVLHLADRRTRTAPLAGRVLLSLAALGAVAVADAAIELQYLRIPKQEETPNVGCCNVAPVVIEPSRPLPFVSFSSPEAARAGITAVHFALSALLALGMWSWSRRGRAAASPPPSPPRYAPLLLLLAAVSVPIGLAFLKNVLSPAFLGRPEHRCPYCILSETPESVVGVALFLLGVFAVGWAALAAWGARHKETEPALGRDVRTIALLGVFGYAGSALFAAVGLGVS